MSGLQPLNVIILSKERPVAKYRGVSLIEKSFWLCFSSFVFLSSVFVFFSSYIDFCFRFYFIIFFKFRWFVVVSQMCCLSMYAFFSYLILISFSFNLSYCHPCIISLLRPSSDPPSSFPSISPTLSSPSPPPPHSYPPSSSSSPFQLPLFSTPSRRQMIKH